MSEIKRLVIEKFGEMSPDKYGELTLCFGDGLSDTSVFLKSTSKDAFGMDFSNKVFEIRGSLEITQFMSHFKVDMIQENLRACNLKDHFTDPANPTEVELDEFYHEQGFHFFLDPRFFAEGV